MASKTRLKVLGSIYVAFWLGAFVFVFHSRVIPQGLPLSETGVYATLIQPARKSSLFVTSEDENSNIAQSNPSSGHMSFADTIYQDRKVDAIRVVLDRHKSPMADSAEAFVISAERHGIDYRIVASIAMVESGGGKNVPGNGQGGSSYNAWGWRSGEGYRNFKDWADGIEYISWRLAEGYGRDRLNPETMERSYCPPCYRDRRGWWANGVKHFMASIANTYDGLAGTQ